MENALRFLFFFSKLGGHAIKSAQYTPKNFPEAGDYNFKETERETKSSYKSYFYKKSMSKFKGK